jgi:type I restriction enzyme S subunit
MSWVDARLDEVADVILGQSPPGSSYNEVGEGVPFFQGKAEFGDLRPTVRKWTTAGTKFATTDDVLLSVRAPVGPTNLAPSDCVIGRGLAAIRPRGDIESRYLLWALRATSRRLSAQATGSTFEAVTGKQVKAHSIPVAPLNEQRRIVAALEEHLSRLDAADASLAAATRRLQPLQRHARSVAIAEGEVRPVGDLLDRIEAGKSFRCHGRPARPDEWGVIKVSAMSWGSFDQDENKAVMSAEQVVPQWEITEGDLLLSRANTTELVGATVLVSHTRSQLLLSDKSMRLHPRDDVDKAWLQVALSAPESRRQMSAVATGTKDSMRNISQEKVKAIRLRVPPLEEQRRIVQEVEERLSAIDALRSAIERAQRRSAALRRAVLERAFRGELVPQDPSDEPAEALLARIRAERATTTPVSARRSDR